MTTVSSQYTYPEPKISRKTIEITIPKTGAVPNVLDGVDPQYLLTKVLDAVEAGIPIEEIRRDPLKVLTSGRTKEIVINTYDPHRGVWIQCDGVSVGKHLGYDEAYHHRSVWDRSDPTLISVIKAGRLEIPGRDPVRLRFKEVTSMDEAQGLTVVRVPEEDTCYKVVTDTDCDREQILGWHEFVTSTHGGMHGPYNES